MAAIIGRSVRDRMIQRATPYILLLPAIAIVAGVLGYAVVRGIIMSFFQIEAWEPGEPFVGLANYRNLFRSPGFQNSLMISLIFVGATIVIGLLMSLVHAIVLNQITFARSLFRATALIPYLVSGVAAAVMWRFLFTGDAAIATQLSVAFGGSSVSWLADPDKALLVIIMANVIDLVGRASNHRPRNVCRRRNRRCGKLAKIRAHHDPIHHSHAFSGAYVA